MLVVVLSMLAVVSQAWARAGRLDRSFGRSGLVTTSFGAGSSAMGQAVALTRGGLIVVAGQLQTKSGASVMAVARYTSAGRLDRRFGRGGLVRTAFPGQAMAFGVAVDAKGRVVVAGSSSVGIAVARYTTSGRLDRSFGSNGKVTTAFPGLQAGGQAVVVMPDNSIVVAGGAGKSDGSGQGFALARYRANGALDPSFGTGGRVFTPFGTGDDTVAAHALALKNGKLVLAGLLDNPFSGGGAFALARYVARTGRLDTSFSGDGKVSTVLGEEAGAQGVLVQPNGRIVAAGLAQVQPGQGDRFALTGYLTNGTLDSTFGNGGIVTTRLPGGDALGNAIAAQRDGRLVAVGQAYLSGGNTSVFGTARYRSNGTLDASFGTRGIVTTGFGKGKTAAANAVVVQPNGRIVVAGGNGSSFALARYVAK
jgi:uncharacterized delta-60 repeat protein